MDRTGIYADGVEPVLPVLPAFADYRAIVSRSWKSGAAALAYMRQAQPQCYIKHVECGSFPDFYKVE